jgi:hypothetical protein
LSEVIKVKAKFCSPYIRRFLQPAASRPRTTAHSNIISRFTPVKIRKSYVIGWIRRPSVHRIELSPRTNLVIPSPHSFEETLMRTILISPGETEKAKAELSQIFSRFSDDVFGVLTYIDHTTPELLKSIDMKLSLKILTSATSGEAKAIARKFECEHSLRPSVNLMKLTLLEGSTEKPLFHQRWLSDGNILVDIGTDLKTGSLGNKEHMIVLYKVTRDNELIKKFWWYWDSTEEEIHKRYNAKVKKEMVYSS